MSKEEIKQLIADAPKGTLTVHKKGEDEIHLVIGHEDMEAELSRIGEKALKAGHAVTWANGVKEWIRVDPIFDRETLHTRSGGYIWAEDGDRVLCEVTRVTMKDGERIERVLRTSWRLWDSVVD